MLGRCAISTSAVKTWLKFLVKNQNGVHGTYRIMDLPKDLVDDFVDFQMKYFVTRESIHRIAGISHSEKAFDEYRDLLKHTCATPPHYSFVCCPEINGKIVPDIVATFTLKMIRQGEEYGFNYQPKTEEVKRLLQLLRNWNNLHSIEQLMKKYNVKEVLEYESMTVRPDYNRFGIANKMTSISNEFCVTYNVPLCVAWVTSEGTKKAGENNGWVSEFTITKNEVAKKLNVTFDGIPSACDIFQLMVLKTSF